LHYDDSNTVFTTEGHILTLSREHIKPPSAIRRQLRRVENLQCPAYNPMRFPWSPDDEQYGLAGSIRSRDDAEFARFSVGAMKVREPVRTIQRFGCLMVGVRRHASTYMYGFL